MQEGYEKAVALRHQQMEQRYDDLLKIGEELRKHRAAANLSQQALAQQLNSLSRYRVSKDMISRAENGQRLSVKLLKLYNQHFRLNLSPPTKITVNPGVAIANRNRKHNRRIKAQSQSASQVTPCGLVTA